MALMARALTVILLIAALNDASAQASRFQLLKRDLLESRLSQYHGRNPQRGATLHRLFAEAGCGDHLIEQKPPWSHAPNIICTLPGTTDRIIVVGAHFDRTVAGDGVVDNWSGASLLPSLYESLKVEARRHTFVFIGFTDEELGLVGSRFYVRKLTKEQVAAISAMVNMDVIGLSTSKVWASRSDKGLTLALLSIARHRNLPLDGVNFERVGTTDSESFAGQKIPRITIHSLTQKSENEGILHSHKDKLSALNLDDYYDSYHLITVYLAFLDFHLLSDTPR